MLGRTSRSKYAVQKKSSKKTAPGRGHKPNVSSNRYYLMPGYTGHVPGMVSMDAGLTYVQQTGQFLDKADQYDKPLHTVQITEPLEILSPKSFFAKEARQSKSQKSKSLTSKNQKVQPSSHHVVKEQKTSKSQSDSKATQSPMSTVVQSPPSYNTPKGGIMKQPSSQHMSPPAGYMGHIPGQLTIGPGLTFGEQTSILQNGSWNPEESVTKATSPAHDPSYLKRPCGYTGHLPGALHLEPGLSYRTVTKAVQHQMTPSNTFSRSSTSENPRTRDKNTTHMGQSDFFTTVPSGYSGHIPGMILLEPGQSYSQQKARLSGSKKGTKDTEVQASPNRATRHYPSGYSGHIPGAHLLEPGLSYTQQTKILEARLHELDENPKGGASSQPPSKPSTASSKVQGSKRGTRSSHRASKASTREPTPVTAEKRTQPVTGQTSPSVYTSKGNVPGYTGHVPNTSSYNGWTFGELTKDFGKGHQNREQDELVKGLRVRMPG